jgi:hypothetical protein
MSLPLKCTVCDKDYPERIQKDVNQAYGCASFFDWVKITSHFGSSHDLSYFRFVPGKRPELPEHGTICDSCINAMLKADTLEACGEYYFISDRRTGTMHTLFPS